LFPVDERYFYSASSAAAGNGQFQFAGKDFFAMSLYPNAPATPLNPWVRILGALQKKINRQAYETWLKPTLFSHTDGNILVVRIGEALDTLNLPFERVDFVEPEQPAAPPESADDRFPPAPAHRNHNGSGTESADTQSDGAVRSRSLDGARLGRNHTQHPASLHPNGGQQPVNPQQARFDWNSAAQLNPRYTFEAFVAGNGNQFARAAAAAVAESPAKSYNPLFLYGGVGVGKTHLMQAIGHEMKRRQPEASICYVSSEKFTNEMINSLRYDKMTSFRDKYRTVDLLLIDDIQFLSQKERTQDEFFHTFNTLHENVKQIVIASDRPPKEIPDIEETRVAILQKKSELEAYPLPNDVALFVAANVRTNVRELEGALTRLFAWCKLHGVEMSLTTAQLCLKQFIDTQVRKISIEAIQRAVADQFGMRIAELKQKNNSRSIVVPRQIAMYLAKQLTEASLPEIGRQFGNKHHTTVMHSISKIEEQRRADKDLNRMLTALQEDLAT
jgi:chromosomal replication initiator protein